MAPKRIKNLGLNLTKEIKHLYTENYKILLKKIKSLNKWKDIHAHGQEDLTLLKCQYYTKWSTDWKQSLKISTAIFVKNGKTNPRIHMKLQGALKSQNN